MSESELLPVEQVDREMAKRVLRGWLENTPSYAGDDPRASHYRRNAQALEIALAALSTTPAEKLAEALTGQAVDIADVLRDAPDETIRHIAEAKDVASCRWRIARMLSALAVYKEQTNG